MTIYHEHAIINNNSTCVIYVNYPTNYEFGLDFDVIKKKAFNLSNKIRDYISNLTNKISDDKVLLVLNGIVIGTLFISNLYTDNSTKEDLIPTTNIESVETNKQEDINQSNEQKNNETNNKEENLIENIQTDNNGNNNNKPNNTNTSESNKNSQATSSNSNTNSNTSKPSNNNNNINPPNSNNSSTNNNTTNNNINNNATINSGKKVSLKLNNGNVISIDLEEYIIGVVGAEMPASFSVEALKAQAVAARTYAMKKVSYSQMLTATTSTQCYKTNDELKSVWGSDYSMYYSKIKNAVISTQGQVIKHNNEYIDAVYFSMSNGKTENAENVWGNSFSYLKSVDSPFDANLPKTTQSITIAKSTVASKLNLPIDSLTNFNIVSKTIGDRVNIINIGGRNFTGLEIRSKLGLRSTDFLVTDSGNNLIFTTKGYGHGVGMSQYGANEMGKQGYTYKQILTHYYTGVTITKL